MSRRPYIPYPKSAGDVLRPRDPRSPAIKAACKRRVETLLAHWTPAGRPREVAWHILSELARDAAGRLDAWAGRQLSQAVVQELALRLTADATQAEGFFAPTAAEAPPAAIDQARRLYGDIAEAWPGGFTSYGPLAWALLVATLEEGWRRFGDAAAAELAMVAMRRICA